MSSTTVITCDVKGNHQGTVKEKQLLPVVFTTDQNEGRSVAPHLEWEKIDICAKHLHHLIDKREMLTAYGAMGHNNYYFKSEA